ncbi:MAG TPA: hypothetical protein VEV17_22140 [Bryobacteraceae bacterium]|nr:hypothetical protein [Bryobacteraceae bacterium]
MIAEIVSLPAYESQVSALLGEDERMAMEFYIASAPEHHPVRAVFAKFAGPGQARERAADFA